MIDQSLAHVLEATGYLLDGERAAPSVGLRDISTPVRLPSFGPDAWWRSDGDADQRHGPGSAGGLTVYFKYVEDKAEAPVAEWQQEIWNQGFSPLLWLVSPARIDLYNGFGTPRGPGEADANQLDSFRRLEADLVQLDALAGRLAMETGRFWREEQRVNRGTSVDGRLLRDLHSLECALVEADLDRDEAQGLIGRCIFAKYVVDREIVTPERLLEQCGHDDLTAVLGDRAATEALFAWLQRTFNGDMFPPSSTESVPATEHLEWVARFLRGEDLKTRQLSLFPYRFDVIPVELISAIYEQFVHSSSTDARAAHSARRKGVYYTPLAAVSLVLDEVFDGLTGGETVLDLTCGSGVFLVEALRRLVHLKSEDGRPSRETIRHVLYNQVYGVDISEAAVRIAAFSLYLAALELDPSPEPPEELGFEPLQGKTLLVGDARSIDETPDGRAALADGDSLRRFDVIVGNPPWSFTGRAGTVARRDAAEGGALAPRSQGLDFVTRARDFADHTTRFGMILSAMPFFGRSSTSIAAVQDTIEALAPVTLINLSDLTGWLFSKAKMPAVALLARHGKRCADRMTLVQARWSPGGERSHTIEIAPSDVVTLPVASWKRNPGLFKAAFLGRRPDSVLLDALWEKHKPLKARLEEVGVRFRLGLIFGDGSRDASPLLGLPLVDGATPHSFSLSTDDLPRLERERAQWPRTRDVYRAPLVLVRQFLRGGPRPVVAVADKDVVFTDAWYGASFSASTGSGVPHLVAGVLGSALASWYLLMTGSAFGVWISRLKLDDLAAMPAPRLTDSAESDSGRRIIQLVRDLHQRQPTARDSEVLDNAVFDLYELDDEDRIIVQDGLQRAGWRWERERDHSVAPAGPNELRGYAGAFLSTMDSWLSASNRRRMRAEIYDLPLAAPHRIVRFVLEDRPGPSLTEVVEPDGPLRSVLAQIGERSQVRVSHALVGQRELRVHAKHEVSIIKPAARRHWLAVCGLEDADAVVEDSVSGGRST